MAKSQEWGDWTVLKLDALRRYLAAFTSASQKAERTLYLDLFAGTTDNRSRSTGDPIDGSSIIALETIPPFSRCVFGEIDSKKADLLEATLAERFPDRDIVVLRGDSNQTFPAYLDELKTKDPKWAYAPVFAFIDQYSAEVEWTTLESLASFRQSYSGRTRKTELWMYFGESMIPRGTYGDIQYIALPDYADKVTAMFGTDEWLKLRQLRLTEEITGHQYTFELVNFMRWRLEQELGYSVTVPLPVKNEHGQGIYTMLFATDHDAGERIMSSVSANAATAIDEMVRVRTAARRDAREEQNGVQGLFDSELVYERGWRARSSAREFDLLMRPTKKPSWL